MIRSIPVRLFAVALLAAGLLIGIVRPAAAAAPDRSSGHAVSAHAAPAPRATSRPDRAPHATGVPGASRATNTPCSGSIVLGETKSCAGSAEYDLTTSGPDEILISALDATCDGCEAQLVLRDTAGASFCDFYTLDYDIYTLCELPAADTYTFRLGSIFTRSSSLTVESVLHPSSCSTDLDLTVGGPGSTVSAPTETGLWCAHLPTASAGDRLLISGTGITDSTFGFGYTVFDSEGQSSCGWSLRPHDTHACTLGSGSGFLVFVRPGSPNRTATMFVYRATNPDGCVSGSLDTFGAAPSRTGIIPAGRARCFTFPVSGDDTLVTHVLGTGGRRDVEWSIGRLDGAAGGCAGDLANGDLAPVTLCPVAGPATYVLFVYGNYYAQTSTPYAVSITSLTGAAGCTAPTTTAFGRAPAKVGLPAAAVGCLALGPTTTQNLRISVRGTDGTVVGTVVDTASLTRCAVVGRAECALVAGHAYRLLVSSAATYAVTSQVWLADLNGTAGCVATTPDTIGAAPAHLASITARIINRCFLFSAPAGAQYFVRATVDSGSLLPRVQLRTTAGQTVCTITTEVAVGCPVSAGGTYLFVVDQLATATPQGAAKVRLGFWRVDAGADCPTVGTAATDAPATSAVAGPGAITCHSFTATVGDSVLVRSTAASGAALTHVVLGADGLRSCVVTNDGSCLLNRAGPYRVVTYADPTVTTVFSLRVLNLTQHAGCANVQARTYGQAPNHPYSGGDGVLSTCATLGASSPADHIAVRVVASAGVVPHWAVYDGDGTEVCESTQAFGECALSHVGPVVLVIADAAGGSGRYAFYDEASGAGCTSAGSLGFDQPRLAGSIAGAGEMDCLALDANYGRFRMAFATAAAGLRAHGYVVTSTGAPVPGCTFDSPPVAQPIDCVGIGPSAKLIIYGSGTTTGLYRLHVWAIEDALGCTDLGDLPDGADLTGRLTDGTDEDCYVFTPVRGHPGIRQPLHGSSSDPSDPPLRLQVIRLYTWDVRCSSDTGVLTSCGIHLTDRHILIVGDSAPTHPMAGTYTVTQGVSS